MKLEFKYALINGALALRVQRREFFFVFFYSHASSWTRPSGTIAIYTVVDAKWKSLDELKR